MGSSLTFYRLLAYLAAGGLCAIALVPQKQVSRGFFRFSALLYAGLMAAAFGAILYLPWHGPVDVVDRNGGRFPFDAGALFFLTGGALALAIALLGPLLGPAWMRRGLAVAGFASLTGVGFSGLTGATISQQWLSSAAAIVSALLLGSVLSAMILGHWYLVMPLLPPDPLMRLTRLFAVSAALRFLAVLGVLALTYFAGGRAFDRFVDRAGLLIWPRLLFGLFGPLVLAGMALPTVKNRDTQPATGMLYVACVLVLVGEGIAQYLGALTGVPV